MAIVQAHHGARPAAAVARAPTSTVNNPDRDAASEVSGVRVPKSMKSSSKSQRVFRSECTRGLADAGLGCFFVPQATDDH